ncbi:MAG: hypothetical protein ACO3RY_08320, partial [Opitutales bacterium]
MVFKYIKSNIAFFMLAGATASALFGKNPETLEGMQVDGLEYKELDLPRATALSGPVIESRQISSISSLSALSPNLYINSYGIQSYGDVITLRGVGNSQLFGDP